MKTVFDPRIPLLEKEEARLSECVNRMKTAANKVREVLRSTR